MSRNLCALLFSILAILTISALAPKRLGADDRSEDPLPVQAPFGGDSTQFEAVCLSSNELEPLAGVTLRLCPAGLEGASEDALREECEFEFSGDHGRVRFTGLETSDYVLQAQLEGFAATTIGPLGYGDSNPQGPRRVVLLMNPVCWDC